MIRRNIYLTYGKQVPTAMNNYSLFASILQLVLAQCHFYVIPKPLTEMIVTSQKNPLTTHLVYTIIRDNPRLFDQLKEHADSLFLTLANEHKGIFFV